MLAFPSGKWLDTWVDPIQLSGSWSTSLHKHEGRSTADQTRPRESNHACYSPKAAVERKEQTRPPSQRSNCATTYQEDGTEKQMHAKAPSSVTCSCSYKGNSGRCSESIGNKTNGRGSSSQTKACSVSFNLTDGFVFGESSGKNSRHSMYTCRPTAY